MFLWSYACRLQTVAGIAFVFMKTRSIPVIQRNDRIQISHLLKDPVIYVLWTFMLLSAFGYYIPTFYTPGFSFLTLR